MINLFNFWSINFEGKFYAYLGANGFGELLFDFGEGAWEMATTSKEGSRHAN